jgi:hypothetical protein
MGVLLTFLNKGENVMNKLLAIGSIWAMASVVYADPYGDRLRHAEDQAYYHQAKAKHEAMLAAHRSRCAKQLTKKIKQAAKAHQYHNAAIDQLLDSESNMHRYGLDSSNWYVPDNEDFATHASVVEAVGS